MHAAAGVSASERAAVTPSPQLIPPGGWRRHSRGRPCPPPPARARWTGCSHVPWQVRAPAPYRVRGSGVPGGEGRRVLACLAATRPRRGRREDGREASAGASPLARPFSRPPVLGSDGAAALAPAARRADGIVSNRVVCAPRAHASCAGLAFWQVGKPLEPRVPHGRRCATPRPAPGCGVVQGHPGPALASAWRAGGLAAPQRVRDAATHSGGFFYRAGCAPVRGVDDRVPTAAHLAEAGF